MKPTIMVFGERETSNLLGDTLLGYYQVIWPEHYTSVDETVDLCIADASGIAHLDNWFRDNKVAKTPLVLPVLLAAAATDLPSISQVHWHHVDGVIVIPFEPADLLAQVRKLLEVRNFSRRFKAQANRLASVIKAIESTSDAISISDTTGKAIYLNRSFTNLYGFRVNELNVRGISNSLFAHSAEAKDVLTSIQKNQSWIGEVELKTKQGRSVPTLLRVDSIVDETGQRIGLISVHTDITERKQSEALLQEQRNLEQALREIATTLTSTLDLNQVLDRILEYVGLVVAYDMAYVVLKLNETARVVRGTGIDDCQAAEWLTDQELIINEDAELGRMAQSGQPIVVPEVNEDWFSARPEGMHIVQSYVTAPIHLRGALSGFLFLSSKTPGYFSEAHAVRLQAFADHAAIALQNAQLYEKAQQLAALQERQRLAHDLHDAISQTLYSTSVIAEALPYLMERDPEQVKTRLVQLHRLTRGAMAEMSTLLLELRPSALIEAGFVDLLRQLLEALQGRTKIETALDVDEDYPLPDDVQTALFYIAQEALNNVVKHAHATHVTVRLDSQPDQLILRIIDNGRGFVPGQILSMSMGLDIMHERAEAIGALLTITGQPGEGTQVIVSWKDSSERKN